MFSHHLCFKMKNVTITERTNIYDNDDPTNQKRVYGTTTSNPLTANQLG